ncbi:MAG: two-component regulator propeller domain-containing protein [Bacteroidales bacterium]
MKIFKLLLLLFTACSALSFVQGSWTQLSKDDGLASTWVRDCLEDNNGNFWFATDKGLCRYNGVQVEADSKGRVWIGTMAGLALFDHGKWSITDKDNGLPYNAVRSISEDSKGNIWVGAASTWKTGGVSVFNGERWDKLNIPKSYANDFYEDSKGNIWILTFGNGVFRYEY